MKELLARLKDDFAGYGYKKARSSFWKAENGFYKLIDFQKGSYGDYFFLNIGLHPLGLPSLVVGKLEIRERPKEHECALRRRMGEIIPGGFWEQALVPIHGADTLPEIAAAIPKAEDWLARWGSFEAIGGKDFSELSKMMPIAPILWRKAYHMLRFYCMLGQGNIAKAKKCYTAYLAENPEMDFSAVDHYLEGLLESGKIRQY